jgi:8-oxo-dGTP pyrophosphatase MutT (NUDIX family)
MKLQNNNYSLAVLKPDFLDLNLFDELRGLLEKEMLKIVGTLSVLMDLDFVKKLYQWDKLLYPTLLNEYLCTSPMPIWIVGGENAIMKMLSIKQCLRKKYCRDQLRTLIHCPDTHDDFIREYELINLKVGKIMKTNNQVEVIVFKNVLGLGFRYLMLKRNSKKGGFWQPITGNVEMGETFEQAAIRELREETGIVKFIRIFDTGYSFDFFDDNRQQHEKVFAVEIGAEDKIMLSEEHTEFQWATKEECLTKYLKYPGNIAGLKNLSQSMEAQNG